MTPTPSQISSFSNGKVVIGTTSSFETITSFLESKVSSYDVGQTLQAQRRTMSSEELVEVSSRPRVDPLNMIIDKHERSLEPTS